MAEDFYVNSPKSDTLQDVITEVGKAQSSIGDRKVEAIINQLITGQVGLYYLTSKIDKNKSPNCDLCSEKETIDHYTELSETQNNAYWYTRFFPGTHDFRKAGVPRTHVF